MSRLLLIITSSLLLGSNSSPKPGLHRWTQFTGGRFGGHGNPFSTRARLFKNFRSSYTEPKSAWDKIWTSTGTVPDKLGQVPDGQLHIDFPYGVQIRPNDSLTTGIMLHRPRLSWPAEPRALYTLIVADHGIENLGGLQYIHWMVANIPGSDVHNGNEVMEYIPPFVIGLNPSTGKLENTERHPMLALVYKQPGPLVVEETQVGCTPGIVGDRVLDKDVVAAKYGLEGPVAGNFFWTFYSGRSTDDLLCRVSRCTGQPFPVPLEGVNDGPLCQPDDLVTDITVRGPKAGSREDFFRAISPFNPGSVVSLIKDTPGVFNVREFQVLEGAILTAPTEGNNLNSPSYSSGDVGMFVATYTPSGLKDTFDLIDNNPQAVFAQFNNTFGEFDMKIVLSRAEDQDFDMGSILRHYGAVMDLDLVNVKDGQEDNFEELRKRYFALGRNNKNILGIYKFDVITPDVPAVNKFEPAFLWQGPVDQMWITLYRSQEGRAEALKSYQDNHLNLVLEFFDTWDCVGCLLVAPQRVGV